MNWVGSHVDTAKHDSGNGGKLHRYGIDTRAELHENIAHQPGVVAYAADVSMRRLNCGWRNWKGTNTPLAPEVQPAAHSHYSGVKMHEGYSGNAGERYLEWICPRCQPRGEPKPTISYDGSRTLAWTAEQSVVTSIITMMCAMRQSATG